MRKQTVSDQAIRKSFAEYIKTKRADKKLSSYGTKVNGGYSLSVNQLLRYFKDNCKGSINILGIAGLIYSGLLLVVLLTIF